VPALFSPDGRVLGGAERYALELARHMAEQVETELVTFGPEDATTTIDRLTIRTLGGAHHVYGNRFNPVSARLFAALRGARVIHCHQGGVLSAKLAALYARTTGRRVFATDHGGAAWDLTSRLQTDRLFHGHLHVSEFSRRHAGHDARRGAEVIYGGVDTEKFSPAPDGGPAERRVLFVGRIVPHKGVDDLVEALPDGLGLDVAGPALNDRFLADLRDLARGKDVRFHHDWDDARLVDGYRSALAVVLPSVYQDRYGGRSEVPELLGQTLLEGMAAGRPAICTDVAGMPEVVEAGLTGFIVPEHDPAQLGERLGRLAADPALADELGRAGRRRVLEHFSWPTVVDRCLRAYGGR
jgi:glycosyltransferase involved in cell wall biosynthesis